MTHPNRGGHTRKTGFPDFWIRMTRDGSEKKTTYIKSYISYNRYFIKKICTTTPSRGSLTDRKSKNRISGYPDLDEPVGSRGVRKILLTKNHIQATIFISKIFLYDHSF